jgi:hypothetical protein
MMSSVPIVRVTNPQKIAKCISPARASLNILACASAYTTSPQARRGTDANGFDGPAAAKTRRWRAIASAK